jgi:hypothetical protein
MLAASLFAISANWVGGEISLTAGLLAITKREIFVLSRIQIPVFQPAANYGALVGWHWQQKTAVPEEKLVTVPFLSTEIPTWTGLVWSPDPRVKRPATNCSATSMTPFWLLNCYRQFLRACNSHLQDLDYSNHDGGAWNFSETLKIAYQSTRTHATQDLNLRCPCSSHVTCYTRRIYTESSLNNRM